MHHEKVFEPLEFCRYVHGELLHVLGREHAMAREVMNLKLCILVSVDLEPCGWFIDVEEVALHEQHEVRALQCCCFLYDKSRLLSLDSELQVLGRQLPIGEYIYVSVEWRAESGERWLESGKLAIR